MNAGKRDGRETADILRIHSVRFKYLVTLFVVIFLACGITYLVTFINIWGRMQQSAELQIQSVVDIFAGFMDRSGLTTRDIVDELRKRLDVVEVYERADELPGPFSGAALEPGKLEMRTVEGPEGRNGCRTATCLGHAPPPVHGDSGLVLQTLFLCAAIASLGAVVAIHRAIRPLQKLNQAIRQVARGNFDVHVDFESRDEMGVVVRNFNWMVGELRNIEYLRKDFVSSVSHEFKTPIAAIQGSVKLLTSAPYGKLSEEKFQKYTRLISDETDRMASLSSNLLRLSRLENQSTAENPPSFPSTNRSGAASRCWKTSGTPGTSTSTSSLTGRTTGGTRSSCSSSG
ncbi:MAG: histidine kinase dimerization/phospho-acceptor domain-containing protein [Anaerotruncus massiliensis (ex Togo et al. 2019)]